MLYFYIFYIAVYVFFFKFVSLYRRFIRMLDFSEVVHVPAPDTFTARICVVAKMSLTLDSGKLAGDVAEIILRSLEGDGIEVLKRRKKMFRCIASV